MVTTQQRPTPHSTWLTPFATWWLRRETERQLNACSDRVLADIGIAREDIPLIARGEDPLQHEGGPHRPRWLAGLLARLETAREEHRHWRRIRRELMSYSDRELDELGVSRRDIPALARETISPSPA